MVAPVIAVKGKGYPRAESCGEDRLHTIGVTATLLAVLAQLLTRRDHHHEHSNRARPTLHSCLICRLPYTTSQRSPWCQAHSRILV